jgi:hypothetical protein
MTKRILLGLTAVIGTVTLVFLGFLAGFLLGALPIAALYAGHLISGPTTDALVPLLGLVFGATGVILAVRTCRRLPGWIHLRRLPRARRNRTTLEAEVKSRDVRSFYYRGSNSWTHRIVVGWNDPVTGEPERVKRRYVFHDRNRSDEFRHAYANSGMKLAVLVKEGHPHSAIVDIPVGPAWTDLW